jgi:hypothetical protein
VDDKLTTLDDVEVPGILHAANRNVEQKKIVSILLSGFPLVQTIGNPVTRFEIEFYAIMEGRVVLDDLCSSGAEFKLLYHDKVYRGFIEDASIQWTQLRFTKGRDWAEGKFKFLVTEVLV